jgi:hypothetical protein
MFCSSKIQVELGTGVHTYNPSYLGGRNQEDSSSKPALGKKFMRPYLKNTLHKKGLAEREKK